MLKFRNISIRDKLILMQVITSVLVLAVFFIVFIITDHKSFKQRKIRNMITIAQVVGANTVSALQFQDNEEAHHALIELNSLMPDVVHAVIYDRNGNVFASFAKSAKDSTHILPDMGKKTSLMRDKNLFVASDITSHENERLGKVIIESEMTELQQLNRSKFNLAAIILVFAVGFSFLVALILQRYISKRLLRVVGRMKEVDRSGDYSKSIEDEGKDEISTLINAFNSLMERVHENQQRKDQFISIASHELKTPLTTIKGYLELLERQEHIQTEKQFIQKALKNANKLDSLIRDLLDVSKIQSGQLKLNLQEFNMDNLVDETIAAAQLAFPNHQIIRDGKFGDLKVFADRLRIEQVLNNLLSNAIKYSPDEKKIIVYSKKTPTEITIKVRDFGIGIPEEERNNIFERFYRTKDMPVSISGFGLGLYISRDIIRRHNGKIWVEAEEKGSAFYITLPLTKVREAQAVS